MVTAVQKLALRFVPVSHSLDLRMGEALRVSLRTPVGSYGRTDRTACTDGKDAHGPGSANVSCAQSGTLLWPTPDDGQRRFAWLRQHGKRFLHIEGACLPAAHQSRG
jgi:hypothetical protein